MPITAQNSGKTFELVPAGNHIARCFQMIEIGTLRSEYQGKVKNLYKVRISWELPNEKKVFDEAKGPQPFSISKEYTLALGDTANLRKDLESWRGKAFNDDEVKAFDITKLLGVPCMLNVIHKKSQTSGNQYSMISGITPMPKGTDGKPMQCPPQINPMFVLSYDDVDWDAKFSTLTKYVKEQIESTPEFQKRLNPSHNDSPPDQGDEPASVTDDLPF